MPSHSVPLYVRLSADPSHRLEQAAASSGKSKRQIVEDAVREHLAAEPGPATLTVGRVALGDELPDVLTLEEAAAMLRIDDGELAAAAERGEVPGRRLGDHWRFSTEALRAWLGGDPGRG